MSVPIGINERWSVDFVSDQLANGRRFRVFNVVDDYSRECVLQVVDFSISGERLVRELDWLAEQRKLPERVVMDNGPELTSKAMFFWSRRTDGNTTTMSGRIARWARSHLRCSPGKLPDMITFPHSAMLEYGVQATPDSIISCRR